MMIGHVCALHSIHVSRWRSSRDRLTKHPTLSHHTILTMGRGWDSLLRIHKPLLLLLLLLQYIHLYRWVGLHWATAHRMHWAAKSTWSMHHVLHVHALLVSKLGHASVLHEGLNILALLLRWQLIDVVPLFW